ncbi:MAG: nuclear transport factor 2 family protein [Planctomycetota bacterium]
MIGRLIAAGLVFASCAVLSPEESQLEQELVAQEKQLIDAIAKQDRAKLTEMLDQQYYSVDHLGRLETVELLSQLDEVAITHYAISEIKALSASPEVAILTYKYVWSGVENGAEVKDATSYATSTWAKRDGMWKSIFYQETPIDVDSE